MRIDSDWTLFLDRDGVINERIPDTYINHWDDFRFCRGAIAALVKLQRIFGRLIIVTNQQGIGKKFMTRQQLELIHQKMQAEFEKVGVHIDGIYYCGELKTNPNNCRKPSSSMGLQAKKDFPEINFQQSVMIGDSISDMLFGRELGMQNAFIQTKMDEQHLWEAHQPDWDWSFLTLKGFADYLQNTQISIPQYGPK